MLKSILPPCDFACFVDILFYCNVNCISGEGNTGSVNTDIVALQ